ncbi:MAG: glutathione synthase [Pseudomonadota bacterium]
MATLRVGFQMDPIEAVDINADSSFRLAEEAQARGHSLYVWTADALSLGPKGLSAKARAIKVARKEGNHVRAEQPTSLDLAELDVIWLRQDPPFDMGYITTTHLLDMVHPQTRVVNDPTWVRNYPEKLLVLQFPELTPRTLITRDLEALRAFRAEMGDVIVKPLYGNGGAGVFRLKPEDNNLASLYEMFTAVSSEPVIMQEFLPSVAEGDKRVILVDGRPVGAINRIPAAGETRSNMHVGGRPAKTELTQRDHEICEAIGPLLREKGQIFVGIDVIGGNLTEINVTSPTGIQELERFDGLNVAELIWDAVEAKL